MRVAGRPLSWLIVALVVFLLWRAPGPMSAILGGLGGIFLAIGNGLASFLSNVTKRPLSK
jgi:F0F1-type ATP synthase assembly protein I